ncbi:MAG TPA: TIGR00341 family protein [Terriglobales bacterium]|nr:TIGR00341 family protein [Terriglobales bacterium]
MDDEQTKTKQAHRASVLSRVAEDSSFDRTYVVMNVLATIVACYGLLEDSAAVVIGAMIIAMLLGPVSGVGLALVDGDNQLLGRASASLASGVLLVVNTAFLIGLFNREIPATAEMLTRTSPTVFDLLIALGSGAAGAFAVVYRRLSVAFVGVAIATALVPPLATASMFLARGEFALSGGAFLLAFANIVGIQFACSVVFFLSGFRGIVERRMSDQAAFVGNGVSIGTLLMLGVLLTVNLHSVVAKQLYESSVLNTLKAALLEYPGSYLADLRFNRDPDVTTIRATVRGPEAFSSRQVANMESGLPTPPGHMRSVLLIRYVHTTMMSANGPLYSADDTAADKTKP